ncbi:hypothetical protein SLA2020_278460 [Shorea laevis]
MQSSEGNGVNGIQMRVQRGHKRRILVAETEAAAIAFAPNPELAIDEQRRVEEPTRNTHLDNGPFFVIKKWSRGMAGRRPGVGERAKEDWGTTRLATGVGYSRFSSMPPPSWPEAPLPQERSWRVTASLSSDSGLYKMGTLVDEEEDFEE